MPKTNDNTGATAEGLTGIVEHGAPINDGRVLSELDPEVNLDGTLIEGEHPDRDENNYAKRESVSTTDPAPRPGLFETDEDRTAREAREQQEKDNAPADLISEDPAASQGNAFRGEGLVADATPADVKAAKEENAKGDEDVSAGTNSEASQQKTASSLSKNAKTSR